MQRKSILILMHNDAIQFIDICNQYAKIFDKTEYEVTAVYLSGNPNEITRQKTLAEHVLFLNFSKKSIRGLKIKPILTLLSLCRNKKFEIVICHRYKPTFIMLWVAQFCRIPTLFFIMHELGTMQSWARKITLALLNRKNMIFAGVSNAVRDDMRRSLFFIKKKKIITLYNVIDTELREPLILSRSHARQVLHLPEDRFVFGNIGRLEINKDQKTLIEAFALIKPHCPQAKLIILGEGTLRDTLQQQIQTLQLTDDVILTGFVPDAFRFMKAFDTYISSSIQEAFGLVLIEAMMAKIPLIATRVNGVPEVVGSAGLLIDAANVKQLADAMLRYYHLSPSEKSFAEENAYQRVKNHFSVVQFKKSFLALV